MSSRPGAAATGLPGRSDPTSATWAVWSTTAIVVVTDPAALGEACRLTREELAATDAAASRFRPDSELCRLDAAAGRWVTVSPLLLDLLTAALDAAELTGGAVDPTVGAAMRANGYDRDIAELPTAALPTAGPPESDVRRPAAVRVTVRRAGPRWRDVEVDSGRGRVRLPPGAELDLGATAKALTADRAAARASAAVGCPVLVNLGGDLAAAGCGEHRPFPVVVAEDHRDASGPLVLVGDGGVATSTTRLRRWWGPHGQAHHLVDPATGLPTAGPWRTVTAAADSCLSANTATTATVVLGDRALPWLAGTGLPARLVGVDGSVTTLNGWPEDIS